MVWNTERGFQKTKIAFDKTLEDIQIINEMPSFGQSGLHPDKVNF